jgi:dephospho-CoA kinase
LAKVVSEFGSDILLEDGSIDRAKLGQMIFSNPEMRSTLESILHPLVRERAQQLLSAQQPDAIVIYNVPLLVEAKVDLPFDKVVTVEAPADKQLERLLKYRGMTKAEAQLRIDSQATPAARANIADAILNSNQDLPGLLKDATALWQQIEREALAKQNA